MAGPQTNAGNKVPEGWGREHRQPCEILARVGWARRVLVDIVSHAIHLWADGTRPPRRRPVSPVQFQRGGLHVPALGAGCQPGLLGPARCARPECQTVAVLMAHGRRNAETSRGAVEGPSGRWACALSRRRGCHRGSGRGAGRRARGRSPSRDSVLGRAFRRAIRGSDPRLAADRGGCVVGAGLRLAAAGIGGAQVSGGEGAGGRGQPRAGPGLLLSMNRLTAAGSVRSTAELSRAAIRDIAVSGAAPSLAASANSSARSSTAATACSR
jgi:hypothetical protein